MVLNLKIKLFLDFTLVIPTLGRRQDELTEALKTLSRSDFRCELIFVAPENQIRAIREMVRINCPNFEVFYVIESKNSSLPQAINQGLAEIRTGYWNWVGDDDRVILNEIETIVLNLSRNDRFVLGVGSCKYFSSKSKREILNKTTKLAASIIFWGPNLVPQPSIVFRTKVVRQLGGVNPKYQLAFDQDLISKCLRRGKIFIHNSITSEYRWSVDTLTSSRRRQSLRESQRIRMQHASSSHQKVFIQVMYPLVVALVRLSDLMFRLRFRK